MQQPKRTGRTRTGVLFAVALLLFSSTLLLFVDLPLRSSTSSHVLEAGGKSALVDYTAGENAFAVVIGVDSPLGISKLQAVRGFLHGAGGTILTLSYPADFTEKEIDDLLAASGRYLLQQTGLSPSKLLLLGYGGQADRILSYGENHPVGGLVLISPVLSAAVGSGDASVLILGTSSDSAPSPSDLTSYYNLLSGDTIKATGSSFKADRGNYHLRIVSGVVDAYQAYSTTMIQELSRWMNSALDLHTTANTSASTMRLAGWGGAVAGLFLLLLFAYELALGRMVDITYSIIPLRLVSRPRFFGVKMLLWIAAIPILLLVLFIVWLLPIPLPIWGVLFCGYLFAYGIVQGFLLKKGKMPGVEGRLEGIHNPVQPKRVALGLLAVLLLGAYLLFLGNTGLFALGFSWERGIWFLVFSAMCAVSFYFFIYESALLDQAKLDWRSKLGLQIVQFIPLVALAVLSLPIASFTAVLTIVQYLITLLIAILFARLVELLSGKPSLAAICAGILLGGFVSFAIL